MDLHQLRVFRAAAQHQGFTRASEVLHLSQSTVSAHIKAIEEELECPLFVRVGRRVVLNPAGSLLLEYSEKLFRDLKNAEMAVREMHALRQGTVRLGTGATTLIYRLPEVLGAYRRKFPEIELIIATGTTEQLVREVKAHRVDLSLIMMPVHETSLEVTPAGREELVVVLHAEHRLANKRFLSPHDLVDLPMILYEPQSAMQSLVDRWFAQIGVVPRVTMEMENIEAIKSLVRANLGVSVIPECALWRQNRPESIKAMRVRGAPLYRELALVAEEGGIKPKAIQELADSIVRALHGNDR